MGEHTNERQPQELQLEQRDDGHEDPHDGLHIHGQPEEARVRRVDDLGPRLAALEHPPRLAGRVHLVPPAQAHEAATRNVLRVVKVGGEEEHRDNEGEDPARGSQLAFLFWVRGLHPALPSRRRDFLLRFDVEGIRVEEKEGSYMFRMIRSPRR